MTDALQKNKEINKKIKKTFRKFHEAPIPVMDFLNETDVYYLLGYLEGMVKETE